MEKIILGDGVWAVNGIDVALTRGGGNFKVERENKLIEADGDMGPVKGRIRKTKSIATLEMNALDLLAANMTKFYPALSLNTSDSAKDVLTAATDIADTDYNVVSWTGKTKDGKGVYIELQNAINLENIDWKIVDKDEIVPKLTFTAAYDPAARTTEPWKIEFAKTASGDARPPVMTALAPKAGAATSIVLEFNEYLHANTLAITDRANLLSGITNDGVTVAITTAAGSVTWLNANTANPSCIITIASTTFVSGKTVRVNAKASAIKDLAGNEILAATNSDAVVTT
jgi:hypothetical protein